MSNQLKLLLKETRPQYRTGSPVLLEACALYADAAGKRCIAQLKFRNLSPVRLSALQLTLCVNDSFGQTIGYVQHQYLNVSAAQDAVFGDREPILLDAAASAYTVTLKAASFEDGSVWSSETQEPLSLLPDVKPAALSGSLMQQFRRDLQAAGIGRAASGGQPQRCGDLWQCGCGRWQKQDDPVCAACHATEARLAELSAPAGLQERLEQWEAAEAEKRRIAAEKAEAERIAREAAEAEARRKREAEEQARAERRKLEEVIGQYFEPVDGAATISAAVKSTLDSIAAKVFIASAATSEPASAPAADAKTVTYTATAKGFGGDVTVTATVNSVTGVIQALTIDAPNEPPVGKGVTHKTYTTKYIGKVIGQHFESLAGAVTTTSAVQEAMAAIAAAVGIDVPAAPTPTATPAPAATSAYTPRNTVTLSGYGQGFGGIVTATAEIDVDTGLILSMAVDAPGETTGIGGELEKYSYTSRYIGQPVQNPDVDALAGATVTSRGVAEAIAQIADLLVEAGILTSRNVVTLSASAQGFAGDVTVTVSVNLDTGLITAMDVDAPYETPGFGKEAENATFTGQYIGQPLMDPDVDAISMATHTCCAIDEALTIIAMRIAAGDY